MDWLSAIPAPVLLQGGAVGLLFIFVIAILTGKLIPRSIHEDNIKEAEDWKSAFINSEKSREELSKSVHVALELGRITEKLVSAASVNAAQRESAGEES